jgi:ABC-type antimicrobial peptide transport system permease subunit
LRTTTAFGLTIAIAAGRSAEALLFGLSGVEPGIYLSAALVLLIIMLGASLLPARKAAAVEPMEALRHN